MMYKSKIALALKVNGRVLREFGDTVKIPFGSEFSILVKNLHSVRAQVRVSIDGTSTSDGTWFVIQPNSEIDLKRFVKDGNMDKGNSFKFIERTASIEDHRGIKIDDGLIRVEVQFEKPYISPTWNYYHDWNRYGSPTLGGHYYTSYGAVMTNSSEGTFATAACGSIPNASTIRGMAKGMTAQGATASANNFTAQAEVQANDAGITVEGSVNDQKFTQAAWFQVESETHVLIMKMVGFTQEGAVTEAVTVKSKPKCKTCGRLNKSNAKFCVNCGTSLDIV